MLKQQVTIEVDVPSGYRLTGEYRHSRHGEYVMDCCGQIFCDGRPTGLTHAKYFILEKVDPWTLPDWLAWLPDDCWIFRNRFGHWTVSNIEPVTITGANNFNWLTTKEGGESLDVPTLLRMIGQIWNPPPVNCIRIGDARKGVVKP